ncbi:hypothetical protein [Clavibacter michiganensis]|uniref:hypothetical protein n=1 Tax=Clavibacter michiganensis TaxID=28447 RepID=UPI0015E29F50|nr:hypothetical protein [Clavibacter michiganensis]
MTSNGKGNKQQPRFSTNDKPDPGVNEDEVSQYAALVGNRIVGSKAEREKYGTNGLAWAGLEWRDTTDGFTYEWNGAWQRVFRARPGLIFKAGLHTIVTNGFGDFSIDFDDGQFPSGVLAAGANDADLDREGIIGLYTMRYMPEYSSATRVAFRVHAPSGAFIPSFKTRVAWWAVGN